MFGRGGDRPIQVKCPFCDKEYVPDLIKVISMPKGYLVFCCAKCNKILQIQAVQVLNK